MIQSILNKNLILAYSLTLLFCAGPDLFADEANIDHSNDSKGVLVTKARVHPAKDNPKGKRIPPEKTLTITHVSNETNLVKRDSPRTVLNGQAFHLKWLKF